MLRVFTVSRIKMASGVSERVLGITGAAAALMDMETEYPAGTRSRLTGQSVDIRNDQCAFPYRIEVDNTADIRVSFAAAYEGICLRHHLEDRTQGFI